MLRRLLEAIMGRQTDGTLVPKGLTNYVQRFPPLEMLGRAAQGERLVVLRSLMGERRLLVLDHPVKPVPRYPHPRSSHQRLEALLCENEADYAKLLDRFVAFGDDLSAIPAQPSADAREPHWMNEWQPPLDGIALYCLLRLHRPERYFEIGSGVSTQFVRRAIVDGETDTLVTSVDPKPRADIDQLCDRIIREPLENVDLAVFDDLTSGDVLFFDGTHRAFMNSDVTVFFLDLLPRLPGGVLVGIHDVYLPFDYPHDVVDRYYSEQYVLAARLLAEGHAAHIVLPAAFVAANPLRYAGLDKLQASLPAAIARPLSGSGFWLET
jgi:hypothetical protein